MHIHVHAAPNSSISVTKREQDSCSKYSLLTKWCAHEGDAKFYHDADGDDAYDTSSTESIIIPEDLNGTFTFLIEHDIPDAEKYYLGGNELTGEVHLFTNYEEKEYLPIGSKRVQSMRSHSY